MKKILQFFTVILMATFGAKNVHSAQIAKIFMLNRNSFAGLYVWHFFQPNLDVNFPINCVMDLPKALVWVGSCHEIMPNLMEKKLMRFQTQHVVYFQIPRFSCPESSDLSVTIPKSIAALWTTVYYKLGMGTFSFTQVLNCLIGIIRYYFIFTYQVIRVYLGCR